MIKESLEDYNYDINKALSKIMDVSEDDIKTATETMELGKYISLTQEIDSENEKKVKEIMEPYMEKLDKKVDERFKLGDEVIYENKKAKVSNTKLQENGFLQISTNNGKKLVKTNEIKKLNEHVLGMANLDSLNKLRKNAGIKEELTGDEFSYTPDNDIQDDEFSYTPDNDIQDDEFSYTPDNTSSYTSEDGRSPALQIIDQSIDNIRTNIDNIRLEEYKQIIKSIDDLKNEIREKGRDYLGERRKK